MRFLLTFLSPFPRWPCVLLYKFKQALYCLICYLILLQAVNNVFSLDFSARLLCLILALRGLILQQLNTLKTRCKDTEASPWDSEDMWAAVQRTVQYIQIVYENTVSDLDISSCGFIRLLGTWWPGDFDSHYCNASDTLSCRLTVPTPGLNTCTSIALSICWPRHRIKWFVLTLLLCPAKPAITCSTGCTTVTAFQALSCCYVLDRLA